ncbi:unnamed protein product [Notodromas monacha]|uniref:Ig-like domain-containing protein n=1 Tax=Notodromas monacha TaxID=399045 RepID=A0A7R9GBG8_9CRUS|nr:unnamed protein product [Notodromas monacha]CAG0915053.1 unnamed protein product [Notodromas monacha]
MDAVITDDDDDDDVDCTTRQRIPDNKSVSRPTSFPKVDGSKLHLKGVTRKSMAPYLCIANNGYPPIVSKRITLDVEFAPTVAASESLVSGPLGFSVELHCVAEAYPKAMYYWTKNGSMVYDHSKYDQTNKARYPYETEMTLRIKNLTHDDFDVYGCVAKNSLGEDSGTIRLLQYGGRQNKESWFSSPSKSAASEIQTGAASSAHQPVTVTINDPPSARGISTVAAKKGVASCRGLSAPSAACHRSPTPIAFKPRAGVKLRRSGGSFA